MKYTIIYSRNSYLTDYLNKIKRDKIGKLQINIRSNKMSILLKLEKAARYLHLIKTHSRLLSTNSALYHSSRNRYKMKVIE